MEFNKWDAKDICSTYTSESWEDLLKDIIDAIKMLTRRDKVNKDRIWRKAFRIFKALNLSSKESARRANWFKKTYYAQDYYNTGKPPMPFIKVIGKELIIAFKQSHPWGNVYTVGYDYTQQYMTGGVCEYTLKGIKI